MFNVVSVILAAGKSSRIGFPKPLLEIGGKSFLRRIIETHKAASLSVYVVLGEHHRKIETTVDLSDTFLLINPDPSRGQLSSLQTVLPYLEKTSAIVVHPVDHPLVKAESVQRLIQAHFRDRSHICIPEFQRQKGHPVLFPRCFYPDLKIAPLEEGARWVVHQHLNSVALISVDDSAILKNINTLGQFEGLKNRRSEP